MSFYMYLASSDSLHGDKETSSNTFHNFVLDLFKEYHFEKTDGWVVALTDAYLETQTSTRTTIFESCIVLSDLVIESYINSQAAPVLRYIPGSEVLGTSLFQPYYISLSQTSINRIRIYLRNTQLKDLNLDKWPKDPILRCTLHFMKV